MAILSLVSSCLSVYIWLITFWDVYRPLSSTIASHAPSFNPLSFLSLGGAPDAQQQTPPRSKRSRVRLENAQREQIRSSLKALLVWLTIKGMESLFDNSLGYILPLYSFSKIFALSFYVCFRVQLSKLVFDSFIFPLGKPNAPLLDVGALSNVVLPTMRFARIFIAIKNQLFPLVESWIKSESLESSTDPVALPASVDKIHTERRIPSDLVLPPAKPRITLGSSTSSDSKRDSGQGSTRRGSGGTSAGEGRISLIARKKASKDSLTSSRLAPRSASVTQDTLTLLQALPEAPRSIPSAPTMAAPRTTSGTHTGPGAGLKPFAFIPPSTPPSKSSKVDVASSHVTITAKSIPPFTPRMPGFLTGQEQALIDNHSIGALGDKGQRSTNTDVVHPPKLDVEANELQVGARPADFESASSSKLSKTNGVRRKRTDEEETSGRPRKSRASPSKAAKGKRKVESSQATPTEGQMKRSVSTSKVGNHAEAATLKAQESGDAAAASRSRRRAVQR